MNAWVTAIGAVATIIAIILRHYLSKEKTAKEKALDLGEQAHQSVLRMRKALDDDNMDQVLEEMESVEGDIRVLLQLRKKTRSSG